MTRLSGDQKRFINIIGYTICAALFVVSIAHAVLYLKIQSQTTSNKVLAQEASVMNHQLESLRQMVVKKERQIKDLSALENFYSSELDVFSVLEEMILLTPKNVFLTKVKRYDDVVMLAGSSKNDKQVNQFMTNISRSRWVQTPVVNKLDIDENNYARRYFELIVIQRDADLVTRRIHHHKRKL